MTQKAVAYETRADKIVKQDKDLRTLYALHRQRITIKQVSISPGGATPSSGGSSGGTGNFLETQGDVMMGPIAFNPALVFITDGRIAIGQNDSLVPDGILTYSSYILMTGGGSPDDLNFIDGAAFNGQLLYLQGTASQIINVIRAVLPSITSISGTGTVDVVTAIDHELTTGDKVNILGTTNFDVQNVSVTVTGATTFDYSDAGSGSPESSGLVQDGNIVTGDGNDVVMDGTIAPNGVPVLTLIFDVIVQGTGAWRVIANSAGGGGGGNVPDGTDENDHLQWDSGAWVARQSFEFGPTDTNISESGFMRFVNDDIMLSARNSTNDGNVEVKIDSQNRFDITESNNGIAQLVLRAQHAINPDNELLLFQFSGTGQPGTLSTNAQMNFDIVATPIFDYTVNRVSLQVPLEMNGNYIGLDADSDSRFVTNINDVLLLNLGGSPEYVWNVSGYDIADKYYQLSEINTPGVPGSTSGRIFLDNSDNKLKIRKNSGVVNLEEGNRIIDGNTIAQVIDAIPAFVVTLNGVQKFSIQNTRIDLDSLEVFGVEKMWFDDSVGSPTMVSMGANGVSFFDINVLDNNEALNITFAGDDAFRFIDGQFQMFAALPNTAAVTLTMFRDDPSPGPSDAVGDIDFDGRDDLGNYQPYASILAGPRVITHSIEEGVMVFQVAGGSVAFGQLQERLRLEADFTAITDASLRFDSLLTPSLDITSSTQGQLYAKDLGAGTTAPFWLDDNGVESNLITGGGGGSFTSVAISVVKEVDENRVSDTVLDIDNELFFTPKANTVYLLEFDLQYTTTVANIKISIQGGADMTFEIVSSNIDSGGEQWSGSVSSNGTFEQYPLNPFSTLATGYAIITVNSDVDTIGLSWAQSLSSGSLTTIHKGSTIVIYPGGTSGGGGGSTIGEAGGSIVKQVDQSKASDTTLDIDDELFFTPEANTLYFIEWNFKYRTSAAGASTNMKVAIQGGADMTYDITKSAATGAGGSNKTYQTPFGSSSNGTFALENATDFISAANGYAQIQVNSDVEPIGISWAQEFTQIDVMTIFAGSILRVYPQGAQAQGGGGGSGTGGQVENITISTAPSNVLDPEMHEDTNRNWFGDGNGASNAGIALGSVNPGVPTVTHTVVAGDFPIGTKALLPSSFGFFVGINVRNAGIGAGTKFVFQAYLNGVALDVPFTSIGLDVNPGTDATGRETQHTVTVQIGDVLGIAVWELAPSTLTLEHYAFYLIPEEITPIDTDFDHLLITNINNKSNDALTLTAPNPSGVSGVTFRNTGSQTYRVNGGTPRFPIWGNVEPTLFRGAVISARFGATNGSSGSGSFSTLNRLDIPSLQFINEYQIVTATT